MAVSISGFCFGHNCVEGGYPVKEAIMAAHPFVDEVVAVDMESTDGTRALLASLPCRVLDSEWGEDNWRLERGDQVLVKAFRLNRECAGDVIVMFEADEVYDWTLLQEVVRRVRAGATDLAVHRVQLTQSFQRCKWYPHTVHRIFPRGGGSYSDNPVAHPSGIEVVDPGHGSLWDVSDCFRDNHEARRKNQSELWGTPRNLTVPEHFLQPTEVSEQEVEDSLKQPYWTWKRTPFRIPSVLEPLVGMTRYDPGL